ncbi:hypothetical protein RB653_007489 [Dictyostelium firmibasis]|uniref:ASPIC/UnbV domain-containing protein n=1 Tax=Dictyostelium firmibasis TaxID=79012 RepID=A0AAN7U3R6_9MYCE
MRGIVKANYFTKNKSIVFVIFVSFIVLFKFQYDVMKLSEELQRERNLLLQKQNELDDFNGYISLLERRFIELGGDSESWGCKRSSNKNKSPLIINNDNKNDDEDNNNDYYYDEYIEDENIKLLSLETMMKIQELKYDPNIVQTPKCMKEANSIKLMCSKFKYNYRTKYNFMGFHDDDDDDGDNGYSTSPTTFKNDKNNNNKKDKNLEILKNPSSGISNFKVEKGSKLSFEEVLIDRDEVYIAPSFGSSWGDFNGDGWIDLYIGNHYWPSRLFENQNGTSFKDVSSTYIKGHENMKFLDKHASAWADFNKDGNLDLLETTGAKYGTSSLPNNLFVNKGNASQYWSEEAVQRSIDYPFARGRTVTWLDYDSDGELDAFVSSQKRSDGKGDSALFRQKKSGKFFDVSKFVAMNIVTMILFARQTDLDNDGELELLLISYTFPFKVYQTNRDDPYKAFTDVTSTFFPLNTDEVEKHQKAIINSTVRWVPSSSKTGLISIVSDLAFGDMDGNGWQDIIIARNYHGTCIVSVYYNYGHYENDRDRINDQPGIRKSSKLKWKLQDVFSDNSTKCVSIAVGDFNNDFNLDIFLVTHLTHSNSPNVMIFNNGIGDNNNNNGFPNFIIKEDGVGAGGTTFGRGESVTMADFNNDGYLDLLVTNGKGSPPFDVGPVQLFKNINSGKNWIEIELIGINENAHGFGSRITIKACNKTQFRDVESGVHFSAQNSFRTHFGLNFCPKINEIKIYWQRSKQYQIIKNIGPNQILRITEDVF